MSYLGPFDKFDPRRGFVNVSAPSNGVSVDTGASVDLREAFETMKFVSLTDDGVLIMAERPPEERMLFSAPAPSMGEIGIASVGSSLWTNVLRGDYNPELAGRMGLEKYDKMRRSDAQVRMALRLIKTPVLGARWYMEPASDKPKDVMIAKFIWDNLTKWMTISFAQVILESLLMLDFGSYAFEEVYDYRVVNGARRLIWRKLAPRHPMDVVEWLYDPQGGPKGVKMFHPTKEGNEVTIPISKMMVFTFDKEAGNVEGISALRSAYKHWYYKEQLYKIDAIQKERHGIGIPIIKLPPLFSPADKLLAEEMGRNLRTNEKAHVILPPNWDIMFAKLEGQRVDALASASHHGEMILANVLGQFLSNEGEGQAKTGSEMFAKATRFIAEIIRDVFNKYGIPRLVNFNWANVEEYPELKVRRIGETTDWRTLSFAVRNLVGARILEPDEPLETWWRDELDMPRKDATTVREAPVPGGGSLGGVKPPPGAPKNRQTKPSATPPRANAGTDRSGG